MASCSVPQRELLRLLKVFGRANPTTDTMHYRYQSRLGDPNWVCAAIVESIPSVRCLMEHGLKPVAVTSSLPGKVTLKVSGEDDDLGREFVVSWRDHPPAYMVECGEQIGRVRYSLMRLPGICESKYEDIVRKVESDGILAKTGILAALKRAKKTSPDWLCNTLTQLLTGGTKLRQWSVVRYIASGSYGAVFEVRNGKKKASLKLVLDDPDEMSAVEEAKLQNKFASKKLAPKIYGVVKVRMNRKRAWLLLMDFVDITLEDFLERPLSKEDYRNVGMLLLNTVSKLHELGWTHGDMHTGNIMLKFDRENKRLIPTLIDFGRSNTDESFPEVDITIFLRSLMMEAEGGSTNKCIRLHGLFDSPEEDVRFKCQNMQKKYQMLLRYYTTVFNSWLERHDMDPIELDWDAFDDTIQDYLE